MDLRELEIAQNTSTGRHPWELARAEVVYNLIKSNFPQLISAETNVMDIGCGDIFLIEQLSKKFPKWKFFAVDTAFTSDQLKYFKERSTSSAIQVFNSSEEAFKSLGSKPADIILLLDVIEHIENDISFLQYLNAFPQVTSNTSFLITVPAYQSLFCSHDVFLGHYRRYTNKLLKGNIGKSGLASVKVGYFFFSLLPPRAIGVMKEKIFPPKESAKGVAEWKNKALGSAFKNLLILDFKVTNTLRKVGIKIPGLSNYIICKKPV